MSGLPTTPDTPEKTPVDHLDRATFLRRGATGGLVLVVGGVALAAAACGDDTAASTSAAATTTAPGMVDDVAIAKLAATAELLAIDFYGMSIDTGIFKADDLAYLTAARQNEQDHYDALAKVLGAQAPKNLTFTYPDGTFVSVKSISATRAPPWRRRSWGLHGNHPGPVGQRPERWSRRQIGAQRGVAPRRSSRWPPTARSSPPSFPKVLTAAEATAAVTPFLG